MLKRIALLALLIMTACRPSPDEACTGDCGGGGVTEPTVAVTAPPKVTGLRATRVTTGVRLVWKSARAAKGYEIYREERVVSGAPLLAASLHTIERSWYAPAARVPGARIGSSVTTSFTDTSAGEGYEYVYRVVAFNDEGDGPPSDLARIKVLPSTAGTSWVDDWLQAPANSGGGGGGSTINWSAAIGTAGGNVGVTAVTTFPNAALHYGPCSLYGAETAAIRPSLNTLLADAQQTFVLEFAYYTGSYNWSYTLTAVGDGGVTDSPIYRETGAISGCGSKAIAFTADVAAVAEERIVVTIVVNDQYGWSEYWDTAIYYKVAGEWVRVNATTPANGALLSGGVLDVELEYHDAVTQVVYARLMPQNAWGLVFGEATTTIAGTGTATLSMPYRILCGYSKAVLDIDSTSHLVTANYLYPVTTSDAHQFHVRYEGWLRPGSRYFQSELWATACGAKEDITIAAPTGWRVGYYDPDTYQYEWGQWAGGPSGSKFALQADDDFLAALPFGKAVSTVSATFMGAPLTASAAINVYGLFWQAAPPDTAANGVGYPVAVTVLGPRPAEQISVYISPNEQMLTWNDVQQAYTGQLHYSACGYFSNSVSDGRRYQHTYLSGSYYSNPYATQVTTSLIPAVWTYDDYLYFDGGDIGPQGVDLYDECGTAFTWQVVGAPAWVRFEALSGTDADPVSIALLQSVAFATNSYAYGTVEVLVNESGQLIYIDVNAFKY